MQRESHTSEAATSGAGAEELARAEWHLRLLRSYFALQAYGGVVAGGLFLLSPILGRTVTIHGSPWVTLPVLALSSWAAFRTRRLLVRRDGDGLWLAVAAFACNLLAALSAGQFSAGAFFSGFGILLAVNVYRHLRWL